eukprot:1154747-Pelagomonas_calceolata.AAC.6
MDGSPCHPPVYAVQWKPSTACTTHQSGAPVGGNRQWPAPRSDPSTRTPVLHQCLVVPLGFGLRGPQQAATARWLVGSHTCCARRAPAWSARAQSAPAHDRRHRPPIQDWVKRMLYPVYPALPLMHEIWCVGQASRVWCFCSVIVLYAVYRQAWHSACSTTLKRTTGCVPDICNSAEVAVCEGQIDTRKLGFLSTNKQLQNYTVHSHQENKAIPPLTNDTRTPSRKNS